jgi:uncharacterized coiled-coil DUF342 family protein
MTDYTNTYPDLANVEDWLNAKGYTGEAGACHQAMSLIRSQEKRIADLRKEADMMHSEYKTSVARIAELEATIRKFQLVEKALNYFLEKDTPHTWRYRREEAEELASAALEKKND